MPDDDLFRRFVKAGRKGRRKTGGSNLTYDVPTPRSTPPGLGDMSLFEATVNILNRPVNAAASFSDALVHGEDPVKAAGKGLAGQSPKMYSDVLGSMGMPEGQLRTGLGLAMDIGADPTSYLGIGAVGKAGTQVLRGVPTAITKAGVKAREAILGAKLGQAGRIAEKATGLAKVAEATPKKTFSTIAGGAPTAVGWEGGSRATVTAADAAALRAKRVEALVARAGPEASALASKGLMSTPEALGHGFGEKAFRRALGEETRLGAKEGAERLSATLKAAVPWEDAKKLIAPTALKLGPIPLLKGSTAAKIVAPIGKAYKAVEKVPVLGLPLKAASATARAAGGLGKYLFSTKTGSPQFDLAATRARDLRHLEEFQATEWWVKEIGKPLGAKYKAGSELADAKKELLKTIEGVRDPSTQQLTLYQPKDPLIRELANKFRKRMDEVYQTEQKYLALPPEYRVGYAAHIMRPEVQNAIFDIVHQSGTAIIKPEFSQKLGSSMRRTSQGTILDSHKLLDDLIGVGAVDTKKLQVELGRRGIHMNGTDLLLFEADPIVAGLGRELGSIRAVNSAKLAEDILSTPAFVKSKGNLANDAELIKLKQMVQQGDNLAIFVPTKAVVQNLKTAAEREALRHGGQSDLLNSLLRELSGNQIDEAAQAARASGQAVEAYVIPREVAEHLSAAYRGGRDPEVLRTFLNVYDPALAWWKAWATNVRPPIHNRNIASGVWQNILAGMKNPTSYLKATVLNFSASGRAKIKVGKYTGDQVYELAKRLGVAGTGWFGADAAEAAAHALLPGKNPLGTRGPVVRLGQALGTKVEDTNRLALFIDSIERGMDPQSAALLSKKYHFDYGNLTAPEKLLFKRAAPFYAFTRFSIPLAVETLIKNPGKVAILGKVREELEKDTKALNKEYVAEYIRESFGIPVRKNADGTYDYFLLRGFIPTVDIAKLDSEELLGMMTPFAKAPLESWFNRDFFSGRPVQRFPGERVEFMQVPIPPRVAHFLRNIVILAQFDREVMQPTSSVGNFIRSNLAVRLHKQDPSSQMRRYVLALRSQIGELEIQAEKARANNQNAVAFTTEERIKELKVRALVAKRELMELNPDAFKKKAR